MGLLRELKEAESLTEREQMIRNYIVEHPENINKMSSRDLGDASFSSAAAVVRFCKKMGYKGYTEFKIQFLTELKLTDARDDETVIQIEEQENVVTALGRIAKITKKAIEDTKRENSIQQFVHASELIHKAGYIDFYVYDFNSAVAHYAKNQLFYAGKIANVYDFGMLQELNALMKAEGHLAIIISHTGENSRLVEIAKTLKRMKTKIIVISGDKKRSLSSMGDEFLCAASPVKTEEFCQSIFTTSVKYLIDVIFSLEFSYQYEENMKRNYEYEKAGRKNLWGLLKDV